MLQILINLAVILAGFAILLYGADFLVKGASSLAKRFGLTPFFIGLTIVAFGTSMPEMMVNIFASFEGVSDIALGNVIGSNIFNLLLILGVAALVYPIKADQSQVKKEILFSLAAAGAVIFLGNDVLFGQGLAPVLNRFDGLFLLFLFFVFLYYTFGLAKDGKKKNQAPAAVYNCNLSFLMIIGGLAGLIFGGKILVAAGVNLARLGGVSEALVALTILAMGTGLPELATSAVAAYRKNSGIALGNVIGSNIFNLFWILGLSATIRPIVFNPALNFDILVLILATGLLLVFINRRRTLSRIQGAGLVFLYVIYIIYLIIRG